MFSTFRSWDKGCIEFLTWIGQYSISLTLIPGGSSRLTRVRWRVLGWWLVSLRVSCVELFGVVDFISCSTVAFLVRYFGYLIPEEHRSFWTFASGRPACLRPYGRLLGLASCGLL